MKPGMRALLLGTLLTSLGACEAPARTAEGAEAAPRVPVHVDSVFPIEEEIRRFRATLDEAPEALAAAEASRDALVRRFLEALATEDIAAAAALRLTRAEFAYLYYPYTRYTARPYELSPTLLWFQMENHGGRSLSRAMQRFGGRRLGAEGHRCSTEPTIEGENRIWTGCVVDIVRDDGTRQAAPLLGPILERDGRFKFVSFANSL